MSGPTSHGRRAATLSALLVGSLLAACATAPSERAGLRDRVAAAPATDASAFSLQPGGSLYGLFLAGEAALEKGSSRDAAYFLSQLSERAPDAGFLKERAFTAALIAGDVAQASMLAPGAGEGSEASQRLGQLTRAVELMAEGKGKLAQAQLAGAPVQGSTGSAVALLQPWAAAMAGDWETATAQTTPDNRLARLFSGLSRAKLLERNKRYDDAEAALKMLTDASNNGMFILAHGEFLERRGRRAEATALYERALGGAGDLLIDNARTRALAKRPAPALGPIQRGAAEMLLAPAALQMTRREPELALALLRLTLRLAPDYDEAWLLVGDAMSTAGDKSASREAHEKVRPSSPEYGTARSRIAWAMNAAGQQDAALTLARAEMQRTRDGPQSLALYADLLRENGRFAEAVQVMDRLIEQRTGATDLWRLHLTRGVALERLGDWNRAEADLQKALALQPEEPEILNYLGFGWADRGQRLPEALGLLQKAALLRPQSGEIRDSLGWVRFRMGEFGEAVKDLERATALAPSDPDINDHLGDAYWAVGRRLEAEFQWRRVLTLDPSDALRASVEVKLQQRAGGGTLAAVDGKP